MKRILYYALIALILFAVPIQFFVWQRYVEPRWGMMQVVQAGTEIARGEIIQETDLKVEHVRADLKIDREITDPARIIGKEASRLIRKGERITADMLIEDELTPGRGEYNMPMPEAWVLSMPGSLLRGDRITLFPVKSNPEILPDGSPATDSLNKADLALMQDIPVSFSKSNNNQEVTADEERKFPTGNVARFEMIVSEEQRDIITKYGVDGYKFIVFYR